MVLNLVIQFIFLKVTSVLQDPEFSRKIWNKKIIIIPVARRAGTSR